MKCQYCNNIIVPVPVDGICPNCGGVLKVAEYDRSELVFPEPPVGLYVDALGDYIEIRKTDIKLHKEIPFLKDINRTISFEQVYAVDFLAGGAGGKSGFLCVRKREDMVKPMPESRMKAIRDETAITFGVSNSEKFYYVYSFLKKCADIVNGIE